MSGSPDRPTLVTWFSDQNIMLKDISTGIFHTMWLTKSMELFISGRNHEGQLGTNHAASSSIIPQKVEIDRHIKSIQAGSTSSFVFTEDNHIYFSGSFCYLSQLDVSRTITQLVHIY
jgi:alpha-tubulin suppressor-like RCC1 family protein